jgi:hypothetical protein
MVDNNMTSVTRFPADHATYFRAHMRLAAVFMAGAMGALWLLGNPDIWAGGFAALAAIGVRGVYLRSDELGNSWRIEQGNLTRPNTINVALGDISDIRQLGSFVQIITTAGHKHLIKYQADPAATIAAIERAKP